MEIQGRDNTLSPGRKHIGIPAAFFLTLLSTLLFFSASRAYAVQSHTGIEGLVSHELGHFLFTAAMVILLIRITRAQLIGPGWYRFKVFLWLIILWNLLTFSGHWLREMIPPERFLLSEGHINAFQVNSAVDLLFYLTRLDHLLLVPAFFMLLLAILKWGRRLS